VVPALKSGHHFTLIKPCGSQNPLRDPAAIYIKKQESNMEIFGHRGFSGKYPENTLLAFEKAIEAGADGIELDVHLTKDGEMVIHHDELLDRTTDGQGLIGSYTLAELKKLDASAGFKGVYGKQEIPTLREYFDLIKNSDIMTNIELKTGVDTYPGIEEKVLGLIDEYGYRDRIIISSFNHYSVMRMKAMAPDMIYGFLEESWVIDMPQYAKNTAWTACIRFLM
jgi:glycerophosphoryl diester phosphodiesterase